MIQKLTRLPILWHSLCQKKHYLPNILKGREIMENKNIKVIKSKSIKSETKEIITTSNGEENQEKKMVRKITQNINNWIKEHKDKKNRIQVPVLVN